MKFFFSSRRRHTRSLCDWSSDVCSSDLLDRGSAGCARRAPGLAAREAAGLGLGRRTRSLDRPASAGDAAPAARPGPRSRPAADGDPLPGDGRPPRGRRSGEPRRRGLLAPRPPRAVTELSVVLVNHDGAECLPAALRALAANTTAQDVECIVVDSASNDESWHGVEKIWPRARALRFEENIGFCRGCNEGARAAQGRLIAFVNFDGEVEPGWDGPLRELLDDADVAVATGLLLDASGRTIEAAGLEIAPNMATFGRDEGMARPQTLVEP